MRKSTDADKKRTMSLLHTCYFLCICLLTKLKQSNAVEINSPVEYQYITLTLIQSYNVGAVFEFNLICFTWLKLWDLWMCYFQYFLFCVSFKTLDYCYDDYYEMFFQNRVFSWFTICLFVSQLYGFSVLV